MKKIVVIGGGHGQSVILQGIRDLEDVEITAIVTVADDGGSTGRLRERYNIPAMGDIRNVLLSLCEDDSLLYDLMNYRFSGAKEEDVEGHSLGNLILTALSEIKGSFQDSIDILSKELQVKGRILPSTVEYLNLFALMDDDTVVKGEANIPSFKHHITRVFYDHEVEAFKSAVDAIREADLLIYGIGSLYTSILPNTIISGIREALKQTKALKVYFANVMTQSNETFDYDLHDHVQALLDHQTPIDLVVKHSETIPQAILYRYHLTNSVEVVDNGDVECRVIERELLDFSSGLVRHSPEKIAITVKELLEDC